MERIKNCLTKVLPYLQIIFSLIWLSNLPATDAYFSVYAIITFVSFFLQIKNSFSAQIPIFKSNFCSFILSVLFSGAVILANYPVFTTIGDPAVIGRSTSILMNLINCTFSFFGGICVAQPVISYAFCKFPIYAPDENHAPRLLPAVFFITFTVLNLIHLFFVEFPGNATEDTFTQISEIVAGEYSNFNTFWHTMILRTVLSVGHIIFSDLNASIALFCVLQILIMAATFTYTISTMQLYGVSRKILYAACIGYLILPYHMALSITIWKDVLFSAACLLILTSLLRIVKNLGKKSIVNYIVFVLGSVLFLLSRTNGWIIYLATTLLLALFRRKNKRLLAVMGALSILGWALLNPVLSVLNVSGDDPVESLSIPIQQVARVITDGCALTEEEEAMLSRVVDLEEVSDLYTEWLSDPMKVELRSKDYDYFLTHIKDYRNLWVRFGMKYPWQYLKAWVDQTKGYWNGGYDYPLYSETITDNPYGAVKTGGGNPVASLFRLYFGLSRHVIFFEPLHSIGLHIWIVILCFLSNVYKKREEWILCVPLLLLVVGLWFGTPVYSCFRYVYPLFASFPLIVSTTIYEQKEK